MRQKYKKNTNNNNPLPAQTFENILIIENLDFEVNKTKSKNDQYHGNLIKTHTRTFLFNNFLSRKLVKNG